MDEGVCPAELRARPLRQGGVEGGVDLRGLIGDVGPRLQGVGQVLQLSWVVTRAAKVLGCHLWKELHVYHKESWFCSFVSLVFNVCFLQFFSHKCEHRCTKWLRA